MKKSEKQNHLNRREKKEYLDTIVKSLKPDFAPKTLCGKELTHYYKNERIDTKVESVSELGIKKGDVLSFSYWYFNKLYFTWKDHKGDEIIIADIENLPFSEEIEHWKKLGLPIYCVVSKSTDTRYLLIEIAFYGDP